MRYPGLERGPAEGILVCREMGQPIGEVKVSWKGSGSAFPESSAVSMIGELENLMKHPDSRSGDGWGHRFDAAGAAVVHRWTMEQMLPPRMIADQQFWRWLAVIYGYDIIRWRYDDGKGGPIKRENFGLKGTRENALFRMYQIGSIVYDAGADDPYGLARAGDVDFWRSHILRQNYANAHPIARTLVKLQAGMLEGEDPLRISEIRELAKDLRRLRANIVFECLTDDGAKRLVQERVPLAREQAKRVKSQKIQMKEDSNGADSAGFPATTR